MNITRSVLPLALCLLAACGGDRQVYEALEALKDGDAERVAALGPDHTDSVPELLTLLAEDDRRFVQVALIDALARIGSADAATGLVQALEHPDAIVRCRAAYAHWRVSGAAEPGARYLVDRMLAGTPPEGGLALRTWRDVATPPAALLPVLLAGETAEAYGALASYGPEAKAALPKLRRALAERGQKRCYAALAIYRITGEAGGPAAALVDEFKRTSQMGRRDVLTVLLELAEAAPADVRKALASLHEDETFAEAARWIEDRIKGS